MIIDFTNSLGASRVAAAATRLGLRIARVGNAAVVPECSTGVVEGAPLIARGSAERGPGGSAAGPIRISGMVAA